MNTSTKKRFHVRPSDICYSQTSIRNRFQAKPGHHGQLIGEVLDDIYYGRMPVSSIPMISVIEKNGVLYSADNRRLWMFKRLETLGKVRTIEVKKTKWMCKQKSGGGHDIKIRGGEVGGVTALMSRAASLENATSIF